MKQEAMMVLADRKTEAAVDRMVAEIIRKLNDPAEHERTFATLHARVAAYEQQFGIPSCDIHRAIDAGELLETVDVCRWIMDYESLVRAGKA
ncbi:MAG: hypothetical protein QM692_08205 [Thermomicrobiales bacterium]